MAVAFSGEAEVVLHRAFANAREACHLSMTIEHLVVEMLKEAPVVAYLRTCGTDLETLGALLAAKVETFRKAQIDTVETQPNDEFSRMIRRTIDEAARDRRDRILLHDLFLSILEERDGFAASLIVQQTKNPAAFELLRKARDRAGTRGA